MLFLSSVNLLWGVSQSIGTDVLHGNIVTHKTSLTDLEYKNKPLAVPDANPTRLSFPAPMCVAA
jgi:hypothetical protein